MIAALINSVDNRSSTLTAYFCLFQAQKRYRSFKGKINLNFRSERHRNKNTVKPEYRDHPIILALLTSGRFSEVPLYYKCGNLDAKIVVVVGRWLLAQVCLF
jgi:hypothetical protein